MDLVVILHWVRWVKVVRTIGVTYISEIGGDDEQSYKPNDVRVLGLGFGV